MRIVALSLLALLAVGACRAQDAAPAPDPFEQGVLIPEQVMRMEISRLAMSALLDDDFDQLEALATRTGGPDARTPSGLYQRSLLLGGLHDAFDTVRPDDDAAWQEMDDRLARWKAAHPDSTTARLAPALAHLARAWGYRGTCYAQCVDEAAWAPFREHVERARQLLEEDKSLAAADPYWYQLMADVATAQQWEPARFAEFEAQALEHGPGSYDTFFALAQRHQPKWGGSAAEVEDYVGRVVDRTRATDGEGMYARLYWAMLGPESPEGYAIDWTRMQRGIDDVLARYPDPWNLNHFAAIACRAGHMEVAAPLLARLDPVVPDAWQSRDEYQACKARVP
jgi:hypothetical protein